MTKAKSTKRALLAAVLALVVSISMLVGTTFAWFTDSVTSGNNKIASGNLEIDLEMYDKETDKWSSIKENKDPIFTYTNWEPGYVDAKLLKVENEGSLALKWKAAFVSATPLGILADVIDVYVKPGVTEAEFEALTRADVATWKNAGTVREFLGGIEASTYGTLTAKGTEGATANLGIALKMRESANNDYMNKTIEVFDIKILATQMNSESDSFGADYDMYAKYEDNSNEPNISVGTAEELKTALNNLVAGQSVTLTKDIDLTGADWEVSSPWNGAGTDVVFDGAGHKITGLTTGNSIYGGLFGRIATNGNMTIKNLVLENVSISGTDLDGECAGGALIGWFESHGGVLTIENVQVNGVTATGFKYIGGLIGYTNVDYAANITGCTVNGTSLTSTFNESGNYKGHTGGLVGYYGKGTITDCTVSNLTVKRAGADLTTSSNRTGALVGTITADCEVASATLNSVTVDGAKASADNVFGPNASATSVSKANITFND